MGTRFHTQLESYKQNCNRTGYSYQQKLKTSLHDITILDISHKNFTFVLILSLSLQNTHETAAGN